MRNGEQIVVCRVILVGRRVFSQLKHFPMGDTEGIAVGWNYRLLFIRSDMITSIHLQSADSAIIRIDTLQDQIIFTSKLGQPEISIDSEHVVIIHILLLVAVQCDYEVLHYTLTDIANDSALRIRTRNSRSNKILRVPGNITSFCHMLGRSTYKSSF